MSSRFQGRLTVGPDASPKVTGEGMVPVCQVATIARDATLVQNATLEIPVGSQITAIYADVTTAYDSATSATLSVGTASGGTQYAGSVNAKTGGRNTPAFTAAQVTAMANVASSTLVATVTSVGQPTVGGVRVMVFYIPPNN